MSLKVQHDLFGEIEVDATEGAYVKGTICGLFIGGGFTTVEQLRQLSELVSDIHALDRRARRALGEAADRDDETIQEYVSLHLDQTFDEVSGKLGSDQPTTQMVIDGLDFCTVAVHIDAGELSLHCDYCIGQDFTDELLVVHFDAAGQLTAISHES